MFTVKLEIILVCLNIGFSNSSLSFDRELIKAFNFNYSTINYIYFTIKLKFMEKRN